MLISQLLCFEAVYPSVERRHSGARAPYVVAGKAAQLPEAAGRRGHAADELAVDVEAEAGGRPVHAEDVEV